MGGVGRNVTAGVVLAIVTVFVSSVTLPVAVASGTMGSHAAKNIAALVYMSFLLFLWSLAMFDGAVTG